MKWKFMFYVEDRGEPLDVLEIIELCKREILALHPQSLIYKTEAVRE